MGLKSLLGFDRKDSSANAMSTEEYKQRVDKEGSWDAVVEIADGAENLSINTNAELNTAENAINFVNLYVANNREWKRIQEGDRKRMAVAMTRLIPALTAAQRGNQLPPEHIRVVLARANIALRNSNLAAYLPSAEEPVTLEEKPVLKPVELPKVNTAVSPKVVNTTAEILRPDSTKTPPPMEYSSNFLSAVDKELRNFVTQTNLTNLDQEKFRSTLEKFFGLVNNLRNVLTISGGINYKERTNLRQWFEFLRTYLNEVRGQAREYGVEDRVEQIQRILRDGIAELDKMEAESRKAAEPPVLKPLEMQSATSAEAKENMSKSISKTLETLGKYPVLHFGDQVNPGGDLVLFNPETPVDQTYWTAPEYKDDLIVLSEIVNGPIGWETIAPQETAILDSLEKLSLKLRNTNRFLLKQKAGGIRGADPFIDWVEEMMDLIIEVRARISTIKENFTKVEVQKSADQILPVIFEDLARDPKQLPRALLMLSGLEVNFFMGLGEKRIELIINILNQILNIVERALVDDTLERLVKDESVKILKVIPYIKSVNQRAKTDGIRFNVLKTTEKQDGLDRLLDDLQSKLTDKINQLSTTQPELSAQTSQVPGIQSLYNRLNGIGQNQERRGILQEYPTLYELLSLLNGPEFQLINLSANELGWLNNILSLIRAQGSDLDPQKRKEITSILKTLREKLMQAVPSVPKENEILAARLKAAADLIENVEKVSNTDNLKQTSADIQNLFQEALKSEGERKELSDITQEQFVAIFEKLGKLLQITSREEISMMLPRIFQVILSFQEWSKRVDKINIIDWEVFKNFLTATRSNLNKLIEEAKGNLKRVPDSRKEREVNSLEYLLGIIDNLSAEMTKKTAEAETEKGTIPFEYSDESIEKMETDTGKFVEVVRANPNAENIAQLVLYTRNIATALTYRVDRAQDILAQLNSCLSLIINSVQDLPRYKDNPDTLKSLISILEQVDELLKQVDTKDNIQAKSQLNIARETIERLKSFVASQKRKQESISTPEQIEKFENLRFEIKRAQEFKSDEIKLADLQRIATFVRDILPLINKSNIDKDLIEWIMHIVNLIRDYVYKESAKEPAPYLGTISDDLEDIVTRGREFVQRLDAYVRTLPNGTYLAGQVAAVESTALSAQSYAASLDDRFIAQQVAAAPTVPPPPMPPETPETPVASVEQEDDLLAQLIKIEDLLSDIKGNAAQIIALCLALTMSIKKQKPAFDAGLVTRLASIRGRISGNQELTPGTTKAILLLLDEVIEQLPAEPKRKPARVEKQEEENFKTQYKNAVVELLSAARLVNGNNPNRSRKPIMGRLKVEVNSNGSSTEFNQDNYNKDRESMIIALIAVFDKVNRTSSNNGPITTRLLNAINSDNASEFLSALEDYLVTYLEDKNNNGKIYNVDGKKITFSSWDPNQKSQNKEAVHSYLKYLIEKTA